MAFNDYQADKELFRDFLQNFYTTDPDVGKDYKYAKKLGQLGHREKVDILVELDDLESFTPTGGKDVIDLLERIEENGKRYVAVMAEAVAELIPEHRTRATFPKDSLDVFIEHRLASARAFEQQMHGQEDNGNRPPVEAQFPAELLRRFEVYFKPRSSVKPLALRALKADKIGKLVSLHGVVIRASEVRPLLSVATYSCDSCSAETFQPITSPSFTPVVSCNSDFCKSNRTGGRLEMQTRGSKFVRFQELKIQEQSADVPAGHVPRTLTIHCKGENTRTVTAGDHVAVTGVFLPLQKSSAFAQITQGVLTETYLEAHHLVPISKWDDGVNISEGLSDVEILELRQGTPAEFYVKLAASIAPEVYGHEDVKKSLLLQLVSGVERSVGGLKIRGTINICLMGDPGVAKSQLLSYIDRLAPRSQLTSGRGSSGVGLTASIMKDPVTGLMTLEAGALMLADQGICCIDEFDKMKESDRTALHEVMEQQTISIAKAGILTTLHARTSVLAAANPAYGRYNPNRSVQDNVALPAALLSRFDILWLLQDRSDEQEDRRLAKHITYVHQHLKEPPTDHTPLEMGIMRRYLIACKKYNPTVPESLSEKLIGAYVELRNDARNSQDTTFTSPRSLLAILRLATALARLRMVHVVNDDDLNEAIRLVERSRDSVKPGSTTRLTNHSATNSDRIVKIVESFKGKLKNPGDPIRISELRAKVKEAGFSMEQLDCCMDEYESLNVWNMDHSRTKLYFV